MDKMKFIPAIATTNSGPIDFYLRLDQVIAIGYANDPKYKDDYFILITNEKNDEYDPEPFYYAHKDIVHKCFDLEEMPKRYFYSKEEYEAYKNSEEKPTNNGCGFDETSTSD